MDIHWFTLIAQIINFLILVWLLKIFLYKRIIQAMDEREKRLTNQMEEAREKERTAKQEIENYREKKRQIEEQKEDKIHEAEKEAEDRKSELVEEARREVEQRRRQWNNALEQEKESFLRDLKNRATREVYKAVRSILTDMADEDLEKRIMQIFYNRLAAIDEEKKKIFTDAVRESGNRITVRSGFKLSDDQEERLREKLKEIISDEINIKFNPTEEIICGLEISSGGRKISWSVSDYLSNLEENIVRVLNSNAESEEVSEEQEEKSEKTDNKSHSNQKLGEDNGVSQ